MEGYGDESIGGGVRGGGGGKLRGGGGYDDETRGGWGWVGKLMRRGWRVYC